MLFAVETLPANVAAALEAELLAQGHTPAEPGQTAHLLAVGLDLPPDGIPLVDQSDASWAHTISQIKRVFGRLRDHAAVLKGTEPNDSLGQAGRAVIVIAPPAIRVMEGAATTAIAGAFLTTLVEVAAVELAPTIAANTLVAGWSAPAPEVFKDSIPLGRLAEPDEIAQAAAYLLSPDRASYITGATLVVDGAWHVTRSPGRNPLSQPESEPTG